MQRTLESRLRRWRRHEREALRGGLCYGGHRMPLFSFASEKLEKACPNGMDHSTDDPYGQGFEVAEFALG